MPEPDAFDPTHALDGWRPPPPAPVAELDLSALLHPGRTESELLLIQAQPAGFDPTHLLDGWRPPAPAPLDLELKSLLHVGTVPDEAKLARLKARGYEMLDVEDIELVEAPAPRVVIVEACVEGIPPAPPLAEADLAPASLLEEEIEQPEAAVDLPLPEEPAWPLFVEEAQVLDAEGLPAVDPEAAPPVEDIGPDAVVPLVEPQAAEAEMAPPDEVEAAIEPVQLAAAEADPTDGGVEALADVDLSVWAEDVDLSEEEPARVEVGTVVEDSGATEPEQPAVAGACESDGEVELPRVDLDPAPQVEEVDQPEEPAPSLGTETPAVEPLVESVASMEVDSAPLLEDVEPLVELQPAIADMRPPEPPPAALEPVVAEGEGKAPEPEAPVLSAAVEEIELPVLGLVPAAEDTEPFEPLRRAGVAEDPVEAMEPPADSLPPLAVEAVAPDFQAPPPELPPLIGDIHLPPVAPPAEVEAPVLDFRAAPPPPAPDPLSVIASIELPKVAPPPAVVEMPALDIAALTPQPPEPDPRLLMHWQAGAWTALARQVAAASEELLQTPAGLRVESHAPQWLCAVWPPHPEDASLGRWPELAAVVAAETTADALQQLLAELPDEAPLWSADLEADWELVAELVLHQEAGLRPAQSRALREFAEAERDARRLHFSEGYTLQGRVARRRA